MVKSLGYLQLMNCQLVKVTPNSQVPNHGWILLTKIRINAMIGLNPRQPNRSEHNPAAGYTCRQGFLKIVQPCAGFLVSAQAIADPSFQPLSRRDIKKNAKLKLTLLASGETALLLQDEFDHNVPEKGALFDKTLDLDQHYYQSV